jgi:hypothetical protein
VQKGFAPHDGRRHGPSPGGNAGFRPPPFA